MRRSDRKERKTTFKVGEMITGLMMVMVVDGIYVRTTWKQRVRVTQQMRAKLTDCRHLVVRRENAVKKKKTMLCIPSEALAQGFKVQEKVITFRD